MHNNKKPAIIKHSVSIEGQRVHYQVAGEGEPLILVHGLCASTLWWIRNVEGLARQYRVYLVDLPGFGTMWRVRDPFDLTKAASWLLKWLEGVGIQRAHFAGHSMGGYICMTIAARRPEMVGRLILVSPAVWVQIRSVFGYVLPLLAGARYCPPAFFPILFYDTLRTGLPRLVRTAQQIIAIEVREEMQAIQAPTLLIWGEYDTLVSPSIAPQVRAAIAGSRLLVLPGAGHVSMFDHFEVFNTAALSFLGGEEVGS